jgi:hypothetical protein
MKTCLYPVQAASSTERSRFDGCGTVVRGATDDAVPQAARTRLLASAAEATH